MYLTQREMENKQMYPNTQLNVQSKNFMTDSICPNYIKLKNVSNITSKTGSIPFLHWGSNPANMYIFK